MEASTNTQAAGNGDKKQGEEDLSMEEILQSIRRIIAEDDGEGKKPVAEAPKKNVKDEPVAGSDVLELTEMLKDDGTVVSLKTEPEIKQVEPPPPSDVLKGIDEALAAPKPAETAAPPAAEKPPEAPAAAAAAPSSQDEGDSLLSQEASSAAAESFRKLRSAESEPLPAATTPAPAFRSGTTVEDMVAEMLRPMMKDWLDKNLPTIVERIVEREVKKLTR